MFSNKELIKEMIKYYSGDPMRIHHFLKVHNFAKTIGEFEGLDENTQYTLETAALVHDIGIKISEEKYGSSNGKYQEAEGPAIAEPMLTSLGYPEELIKRVCFLIAHHHTYDNITGIDYQILVEADFLVNVYEDKLSLEAAKAAYDNILKTKSGKEFFKFIYPESTN